MTNIKISLMSVDIIISQCWSFDRLIFLIELLHLVLWVDNNMIIGVSICLRFNYNSFKRYNSILLKNIETAAV